MLLVLVEYSDEEVDGSSESVKKGPAYSWTDAIIIGGMSSKHCHLPTS